MSEQPKTAQPAQKEITKPVGCLLTMYSIGMVLAVFFLSVNYGIWHLAQKSSNLSSIQLLILLALSLAQIGVFVMPIIVESVFKQRRFDTNIRFGVGTVLVTIWFSNSIFWLFIFGFFGPGYFG